MLLPVTWLALLVCSTVLTGLFVLAKNASRRTTSKPAYTLPSDLENTVEIYDVNKLQYTTKHQPTSRSFRLMAKNRATLILKRVQAVLRRKDDDVNEGHRTVPSALKEGLKDSREPELIFMLDEVPECVERYWQSGRFWFHCCSFRLFKVYRILWLALNWRYMFGSKWTYSWIIEHCHPNLCRRGCNCECVVCDKDYSICSLLSVIYALVLSK